MRNFALSFIAAVLVAACGNAEATDIHSLDAKIYPANALSGLTDPAGTHTLIKFDRFGVELRADGPSHFGVKFHDEMGHGKDVFVHVLGISPWPPLLVERNRWRVYQVTDHDVRISVQRGTDRASYLIKIITPIPGGISMINATLEK